MVSHRLPKRGLQCECCAQLKQATDKQVINSMIKLKFKDIQLHLISIVLFLNSFLCVAQNDILKRIQPEEAGFSSEKLMELDSYLEEIGSSSVILISDGKVFYEWGDIHKKHLVHSVRKAMLNSLYGIYIGKGVIDTSLTMAEIGIDDIEPKLSELEKSAKIIDLLKARSGIYHPAAAETSDMEKSKPARGSKKPGEQYYYNNWDFNTLGAIFEKMTGKSIYNAFYEDVAQPIGMLNYYGTYDSINTSVPNWEIPMTDGYYRYEPNKSQYPAYHFRISAYDLALYGILYANNGEWEGKQIVPMNWIEYSIKPHSITNEKKGYASGILWDINFKRGSYQFAGYGGQLLTIYPDSKLVIVHRADTEMEHSLMPMGKMYAIFGYIFGAKNN